MFEICQTTDLAKLIIKRQLRNNQSIMLLIKSTDNVIETESILKEYSKKCKQVFYQKEIEKPNYDEVNQITSTLTYPNTLNIEDISSDINIYFKNLSPSSKNLLIDAIKTVFFECKNNQTNPSQLKNSYIRVLVSLNYRLSDIVYKLEEDNRLLYVGKPQKHDVLTMTILGLCGCDVVICDFETSMTAECLCNNRFIGIYGQSNGVNLDFLKYTDQGISNTENKTAYPNGWIDFKDYKNLENCLKLLSFRINDRFEKNRWKTIHLEIQGTSNGYQSQLENFLTNIKASNRPHELFNVSINKNTYDEINSFKNRKNTDIFSIFKDYPLFYESGLPILIQERIDKIIENKKFTNDHQKESLSISLKTYLIRYLNMFFRDVELINIPIIIAFNINKEKDKDLLYLLELLPTDIVAFYPQCTNPYHTDMFSETFKIVNIGANQNIEKYPVNSGIMMSSTVAFQAEQELNSILYTDTSLFAIRQFKNVNPITIQSTYEELYINWNEPAKYRENFNVVGDLVTVPTLFMKINGVNNSYNNDIRKLIGPNTLIYQNFPINLQPSRMYNDEDLRKFARQLYFNGEINFQKLIKSQYYTYGFYSEETQQLIIDKVKKLISLNWDKSNKKNLVYDIIDVLFRLPPEILQLIHNYDFTDQIPKLVIYNGGQNPCTLSDCIIIMFLKLIGFDIVIFSPTGYRVIEQYIDNQWFNEYTIGQFDFNRPMVNTTPLPTKKGFFSKFFK